MSALQVKAPAQSPRCKPNFAKRKPALALYGHFLPAKEPGKPYSSPTLRLSLRFSRLRLFLSHFQRMRPFFFHFLGLDPNKSPNEYFSSSVASFIAHHLKKAC
ncbi:MAG: hypothetical protein WCY41_01435 [Candidatus Micrarchaeia archaeon]